MPVNNGKLEGLITIPSSTTLSITDSGGSATATLTAGTYYWSSAGSTANDFPAQLEADLSAAGAGDTWAAAIDASENGTGKLTIQNTSHNSWGIAWTSTSNGTKVRDLCGFASNIVAASTAEVGDNQVELLWLPDGGIQTAHGDQVPVYETDATVAVNPAGNVYALYGQRRKVYPVEWLCTRNKVHIQAETTTNESFEQFWLDSFLGEANYASVGNTMRLYWDADTDGTYVTVRPAGELLSGFNPAQELDRFVGLYRIVLDRLVEVPS